VLSGIAGIAPPAEGSDPFQSWRSQPFPLPPQPVMYVARILANGATQLGYHPFNYPSAVITAPYAADPRPTCVSCGLCTNYGCPRNAKGSPAVTTLRRALLTGRCQLRYNAFAARMMVDGTGRHVTGVEYIDNNGQRQTVTADKVILAASAIESARLCLLSDPSGPGIGNSSGLVGRHLTFHLETIAVGIYKQRVHGERGRSITMGMADFRGITAGGTDVQANQPLGGAIEFGTSSEPTVAAQQTLQPEAVTAASAVGVSFKQLIRESPFCAHIAILLMHGEDAPQATNRIDLDPTVRDVFGLPVPRVTYKNHAFELDAMKYYQPLMLQVHERAGAAYGFFQPFDPSVPSQSRHIMGGLRMGDDPTTSVCDPWGKFHDLDNLYCVDGAVFPTGSGYNPTPTIIAMALRTAGAIVSAGAPERSLRFAR
jgi:choline dehydrogenase-like flavoprotein